MVRFAASPENQARTVLPSEPVELLGSPRGSPNRSGSGGDCKASTEHRHPAAHQPGSTLSEAEALPGRRWPAPPSAAPAHCLAGTHPSLVAGGLPGATAACPAVDQVGHGTDQASRGWSQHGVARFGRFLEVQRNHPPGTCSGFFDSQVVEIVFDLASPNSDGAPRTDRRRDQGCATGYSSCQGASDRLTGSIAFPLVSVLKRRRERRHSMGSHAPSLHVRGNPRSPALTVLTAVSGSGVVGPTTRGRVGGARCAGRQGERGPRVGRGAGGGEYARR